MTQDHEVVFFAAKVHFPNVRIDKSITALDAVFPGISPGHVQHGSEIHRGNLPGREFHGERYRPNRRASGQVEDFYRLIELFLEEARLLQRLSKPPGIGPLNLK